MLLLILTNLCFALAIVGNKFLLYKVSPLLHVAVRMGIPGVVIFFFHSINSLGSLLERIWKNRLLLLRMMIVTTLLPLFLKNYALQVLSSGKFALLGSIDPFVAAFWAYLLLNEILVWQQFIGVFIAFLAVLLVLLDKSTAQEHLFSFGYASVAELGMILAVFLSKLGWVFNCQLLKAKQFGTSEINGIVMTGAGIAALILVAISGSWGEFSILKDLPCLGCLILVLVINTLGYQLFTICLQRYSFTMVSIAGCSIPILVSIFGALFWNERLGIMSISAFFINLLAIRIFVSKRLFFG